MHALPGIVDCARKTSQVGWCVTRCRSLSPMLETTSSRNQCMDVVVSVVHHIEIFTLVNRLDLVRRRWVTLTPAHKVCTGYTQQMLYCSNNKKWGKGQKIAIFWVQKNIQHQINQSEIKNNTYSNNTNNCVLLLAVLVVFEDFNCSRADPIADRYRYR